MSCRSRKSLPRPTLAVPSGSRSSADWMRPCHELLPRYGKYLTAEEKSITLRQLMSMTSGFPSEARGDKFDKAFERRDPIPAILTGGLESSTGAPTPPDFTLHVACSDCARRT